MNTIHSEYKFDTGNDAIIIMEGYITKYNNLKIRKRHKPISRLLRFGQLKIAHPDYVKWLEEKVIELQKQNP